VCLIVTFQEGLGVSSVEMSDSVRRIGVKLVGNMAHCCSTPGRHCILLSGVPNISYYHMYSIFILMPVTKIVSLGGTVYCAAYTVFTTPKSCVHTHTHTHTHHTHTPHTHTPHAHHTHTHTQAHRFWQLA
jgi:hypothetical protein